MAVHAPILQHSATHRSGVSIGTRSYPRRSQRVCGRCARARRSAIAGLGHCGSATGRPRLRSDFSLFGHLQSVVCLDAMVADVRADGLQHIGWPIASGALCPAMQPASSCNVLHGRCAARLPREMERDCLRAIDSLLRRAGQGREHPFAVRESCRCPGACLVPGSSRRL